MRPQLTHPTASPAPADGRLKCGILNPKQRLRFSPLQPTNVTRSLAFTKIVCSTAKPHLGSLIARFGPASSESNHFANRRIRPLRADCSVIWTGNWDSGGSLFRHSRTPSLVEIGRLARKEDTFAFLLSFSPRLSSSPHPLLRLYHRRLNW
ncbi:unnamed protein product [Colletotrichum noveboracense]|uniref:Uncharacterized protein n=1 Tax=Colletotrichum noveboracense TaxID=2664923 RepID=A0A9W4WFB9_9PEZI|nr:unnamed protein product [Colletotrichum noveboracense]